LTAVSAGGGGSTKHPLTGVAGDGGADDPIVASTTYTNSALVGLGGSDGRIMININGGPLLNYGINSAFTFNQGTGEISDLNPWTAEDAIYVDLNQ
jgi:hypothetical protein